MLYPARTIKWTLKTVEEHLVAGVDRLLGFPRERARFRRAHGYPLNLKAPRSLNEKICYKKVFDRNPLLSVVADKLRVRDYIVEQLGADAEQYLIPLYAVAKKPEDIHWSDLPDQFVLKSNHGSGHNLIVRDRSSLDLPHVFRLTRDWLREPYGIRNFEWAYTKVPRRLLVETLLTDDEGNVPADYKFNMIGGKCTFIQVDQERYSNFSRSLFTPDWEYLDVRWKRPQGGPLPAPDQLTTMLALAERLARPFDYMRVDFYAVNQRVYIGELTNYPARGRGRFAPREFDFEIGRRWALPSATAHRQSESEPD